MRVPARKEAQEMLATAEKMNPGAWVAHCRVAACCAEKIALACPGMDSEAAYALGLLHDIGRRVGVCGLRHVLAGYEYLQSQGYGLGARICLTHSFPVKNIAAFAGENDLTEKETEFLTHFLEDVEYDEYDRLIQLCDALAYPTGPCVVEKRLVDVAIRKGVNPLSVDKWKEFLALKEQFDQRAGKNIYSLFDRLVL